MTRKKSPDQFELSVGMSPMPELLRENDFITFGRVPTDYFTDKHGVDYADITEEQVRAVRPERLRSYLFSNRFGNVDGVVLGSDEYQRVVRHPSAYQYRVEQNTFEALALDDNLERRAHKARKTGAEALAGRIEPMGRTLSGIQAENEKINRLYKASLSPGYAHIRAQDMLALVTEVDLVVFGRMLKVFGFQRYRELEATNNEHNWTRETSRQMRRALDVRLYLGIGDGDLGLTSRLKSWQDMLILAQQYGQKREQLFTNRIGGVSQKVGEYTVAHSDD
jgi:hypothetical protein